MSATATLHKKEKELRMDEGYDSRDREAHCLKCINSYERKLLALMLFPYRSE